MCILQEYALTIWDVLVGDIISTLEVYAVGKLLQLSPWSMEAEVLHSIVWFGLDHSVLRQTGLQSCYGLLSEAKPDCALVIVNIMLVVIHSTVGILMLHMHLNASWQYSSPVSTQSTHSFLLSIASHRSPDIHRLA